jgi:hypothetical protein
MLAGLWTLIQTRHGPDRYVPSIFFETMPSATAGPVLIFLLVYWFPRFVFCSMIPNHEPLSRSCPHYGAKMKIARVIPKLDALPKLTAFQLPRLPGGHNGGGRWVGEPWNTWALNSQYVRVLAATVGL